MPTKGEKLVIINTQGFRDRVWGFPELPTKTLGLKQMLVRTKVANQNFESYLSFGRWSALIDTYGMTLAKIALKKFLK